MEDECEDYELKGGDGEEAVHPEIGREAEDTPDDAHAEHEDRDAGQAEEWVTDGKPDDAEEGCELNFKPDDGGCGFATEADGEGVFANFGVFFTIAEVIDGDEDGGEEANLCAEEEGFRRPGAELDEDGAGDGDEAEEEDDEELAKAAVGEWEGAAGVAVGEEQGG